jgi:hypothetical protein
MMMNTLKSLLNDTVKIGLLDGHNESTEHNRLSMIYRRAEQVQHGREADEQ